MGPATGSVDLEKLQSTKVREDPVHGPVGAALKL